MKSLIRQVRINISSSMYEKIIRISEDEKNPQSVSGVVRDALENYLSGYKHIQNISTINELKPLVNPGNFQTTTSVISQDCKTVVSGTDWEDVKERLQPDKDIKTAFSLSGIKPGPGAPQRLAAIGVKSIDVLLARRAKNQGREYNHDLEQYFDVV